MGSITRTFPIEQSFTMSDIEDRLTEEITLLSTKLVTAVSKQSELEEKLLHYHRENSQLKTKLSNSTDFETKYDEIDKRFNDLTLKYNESEKVKNEAQQENKKLQAEVEDLTASLFDEANKMVSDASRETYNFKIKNKKLYEELEEKDHIISSLQNELIDLKKMLENSTKTVNTNDDDYLKEEESYFNASLFSPKAKSIRYDTENYVDFKEFLKFIIQPTFQFDLPNLKLSKFFKKIWVEEIENSITVPSTNFLNRWQKGRLFWNLVVEGKVTIEPVKGINETLKIDYQKPTSTGEPIIPIAIDQPCEFCQEQRNDNLEHSRLHIVKLSNPDNLNDSIGYPICNFCLIKLRNICEFFAKLRLINKNIYKLTFDNDEYQIIKLYLILNIIRSKIFWSKIGYWDNVNEINVLNVDEIDVEHFKLLFNDTGSIKSNEAIKSKKSVDFGDQEPVIETEIDPENESKVIEPEVEEPEIKEPEVKEPENEPDTEEPEVKVSEAVTEIENKNTTESQSSPEKVDQTPETAEQKEPTDVSSEPIPSKAEKKKKKKKKSKVASIANTFEPADLTKEESDKSSGKEEDFADTVEEFSEPQLTRKNSTSKQFSEKVNNDLDNTLKMLQESLDEK